MEEDRTREDQSSMLPEPSPRGPPEPEQPPQQQAASTMMSSLAAEQEAQSQGPPHSSNRMNYVLFENLPRGISADDDDDDIYNDTNSSSVLTLPNIPSPMTQPSPSLMANNNPNRPKPSTTDYHPSQTPAASFSRGSQSQSRKKNNNDEEDTFYDDRSLEFRIQRTLSHAPQPVHMLNTPASVPVTPGGPLSSSSSNSAHAAPSTVHKTPTFHFQNISDDDNDNHYNNDNMQSHRSAMAIMKLKQDLRGAINNLYLYKQEKEAAESRAQELKRQNEQLLSEQKQVQEQAKAMEEERAQMEQTKTELQSYKDQLEKLQEEKNQMAKDMEQLKTAKERAEQENEELATRIRTVLREHQEDLKSFGENTDARVSRLKGELETANQEMETLQNSLAEAKKEATEVAQEREEETNQLKAELLAMTEKRDSCLRELEELKTATQTTSSSEEKPGASDSGSEYQSTTEAIEDSLDMATTLKESKQKLAKTEEEMAQVKSENETQLQEIQRLAAEVGEMKQKASPTHSNATPSNSNLAQKHVAVQTYTASSADLSIQDRLLRIRDASERVALVKEHHNEIARLKAQYESQIKDLTSLHEDTLRERLEEETSKLENQHKDAMERLQSELETKMASMEKRHRLEVERLKEEIKTNAKISDESLQVAMTKVTSLKQRLERETTKREKLQEELKQLEETYASEKQRLTDEHMSETQSLKRKWAEEKAILLDVIQRDCNLVFEQNRHTSHTSPKSVVCGFPSLEKQFDPTVQMESPTNRSQRQNEEQISTYSLGISPRYSDIEQELRETEALVQTILGSKPSEQGASC